MRRSDFNQGLLRGDVQKYGSVELEIHAAVTDSTGISTTATRTITIVPAPLPLFISGSGQYSGRRPKDIYFSGDAGNIVTRIRWSQWTTSQAVGRGTSNILSCVPNCAQGSATPVPTTVVLSRPSKGHFTFVTERRDRADLHGPIWNPGLALGRVLRRQRTWRPRPLVTLESAGRSCSRPAHRNCTGRCLMAPGLTRSPPRRGPRAPSSRRRLVRQTNRRSESSWFCEN